MKLFGRNFGKRKALSHKQLMFRIETADNVIGRLLREVLKCDACNQAAAGFCASHRKQLDRADRVLIRAWDEMQIERHARQLKGNA